LGKRPESPYQMIWAFSSDEEVVGCGGPIVIRPPAIDICKSYDKGTFPFQERQNRYERQGKSEEDER